MDCLDREDKNMNRRVVVTGLGAITPIGNNVPEFWSAVKQQKVGIGEITHFDATDYKCHIRLITSVNMLRITIY